MNKKQILGYRLRLAHAILLLCGTVGLLIYGIIASILFEKGKDILALILFFSLVTLVLFPLTILSFIGAFKGRTTIGGNVLCIVIGAMFSFSGILAIIGGIIGYRALAIPEPALNNDQPDGNIEAAPDKPNEN